MARAALELGRVYALLEPGPVVLMTTAHGKASNAMTMSWHTMLEFEPPLVGCVVSDRNHSFSLLDASGECVLNIPTVELADAVVGCGNTHGPKVDKFARFGLARSAAATVGAPLLDDCVASLECVVEDRSMVAARGLFVLRVQAAWADPARLEAPRTLHHRGYGRFMVAGETIELPSRMR